MRLIDADALKTKAETIQTIDCWHMRTEEQAVLVEHIDNAPTIDAVPVVRCNDCKHSRNDELWHMRWSKGVTVKDEHFCADAERKDDEID